MKKVRKQAGSLRCCSYLEVKMKIEGEDRWKKLYCPLNPSVDGETCVRGVLGTMKRKFLWNMRLSQGTIHS